jgi:glycosyltransferase involved in cell wall biosynthesis
MARFVAFSSGELRRAGWRAAARSVRGRIANYVAMRITSYSFWWTDKVWGPAMRALPLPRRRGALFIGYVQAGLGLGESLRGLLGAVARTGLRFGVYPFQAGVENRLICEFLPERYDTGHRYRVNVIEVAADQVPVVFETLDSRILAKSYNVLRTYWELSTAPEAWRPMLAGIDEIWAPNTFVAEAFAHIFDGPIVVVRPCVEPPAEGLPDRSALGLAPGVYYFLFTFDYFSHPARKNPAGVLEAFQRAFPMGDEPVGLVLKSVGAAHHYPELRQTFLKAAAADPRIRVIDETWSRPDVLGLLRACDCYVSLHRSEGFGLGMAEALYFGRSVIGTAYSGNVDFLTETTGFPVTYALRAVQQGEYAWAEGQVWAEPDLGSAVAAFQTVVREPEIARCRAEAGARFIRERFGADAVGAAVKARLKQIGLRRRRRRG